MNGERVYCETEKRLKSILKGDDSAVKAKLAKLRHGIGKKPGEDPALWGMLFEELPDDLLGRNGKPSVEEWAIYDALILYALHQQGNDPKTSQVNEKGISLGKAAARLVYMAGGSDDDRERIGRRFNQIALADEMESLSYYLRTFIPLLRGSNVGLDYAMLAQDIYRYFATDGQTSVRLKWGQDFYSREQDKEEE